MGYDYSGADWDGLLDHLRDVPWEDSQIFHSCTKLIASDIDIDEAFKSMHQSIMSKIKKLCL